MVGSQGGLVARVGRWREALRCVIQGQVCLYSAHKGRKATWVWRRGRDSNPRSFRSTVFKTATFDRSVTPPQHFALLRAPNHTGLRWFCQRRSLSLTGA